MTEADSNMFRLEDVLHPVILEHAYPQFRNGHLRSAVLDAFIAVFDMIRERTALPLDGAEIVGRAFSLSEPRLIVSELDTDSGKNDQKGFIQLLQGAYLSVRNPKAHSLQNDLDSVSAAQYLVFASLLARRVEAAVPGNFLRFDGLYVSTETNHKSGQFVRFFEDGEVLVVSIGGDEEDEEAEQDDDDIPMILSWLTKERAGVYDYPRGNYVQNGNRLEFSAKWRSGEIKYQGEIRGETLFLIVQGGGRRGERQYNFRKK
jgi:uncharacterized protein (TIGR02391 family)